MRIHSSVVEQLKANGVDYMAVAEEIDTLVANAQLDVAKSGETYSYKAATAKKAGVFKSVQKETRKTDLTTDNSTTATIVAVRFAVWHTALVKLFLLETEFKFELPKQMAGWLKNEFPYEAVKPTTGTTDNASK